MSVDEQVGCFLDEDRILIHAIAEVRSAISQAVELIATGLNAGGRLVYIGAGTSGRLGVLDASECPPTFGVEPTLVCGLMAGGETALLKAVEGAEDDVAAGGADLSNIGFAPPDVVVGITASGTTPYVKGGLAHARALGAKTILVACNPSRPGFSEVDVLINPVTGPELITGSTRLKAGTATKMILNMLSSISMIRIGKVYENLMVDVQATNAKLRKRACRIVMTGGSVDEAQAEKLLEAADGEAKTAICMARRGMAAIDARHAIAEAGGFLYKAIGEEHD
ncbi:MAG: N-acetylmuramic acid 6-phosphate etherase [Candidatus Riflebacteria bacterium]|nr:N-acetylmuramic acid 6-phosphate etherase [Candidatus Riflebacteria bacterium]